MGDQAQYLSGKKVAARYGVSAMTRYRWEHNAKLGFPQALIINNRKFWSVTDLEAWERLRLSSQER
jgi:predicted DNA-binding transcriptional regulator AlpA